MSLPYAIAEVKINTELGTTNQLLYYPRMFTGLWVICVGWTVEVRKTIPDSIFLEAAKVLAELVSEADLALGAIYPKINEIRSVSLNIAAAVAKYVYANGLTEQTEPEHLTQVIEASMYNPQY